MAPRSRPRMLAATDNGSSQLIFLRLKPGHGERRRSGTIQKPGDRWNGAAVYGGLCDYQMGRVLKTSTTNLLWPKRRFLASLSYCLHRGDLRVDFAFPVFEKNQSRKAQRFAMSNNIYCFSCSILDLDCLRPAEIEMDV